MYIGIWFLVEPFQTVTSAICVGDKFIIGEKFDAWHGLFNLSGFWQRW